LAVFAATTIGCRDEKSPAPPPNASATASRTAPRAPAAPIVTERPTIEQCEHALAHLVDLELAGDPAAGPQTRQSIMTTTRARFFDSCMQGGRTMLNCVIDAQDLDAVARCDK
jgi:hypothetical protein